MVRVKRLAGNEIELGIGYRRSNLGQVTYRRTKGTTYVVIWGPTDKDLREICRNQYEHPGSAIGYWPESRLGHVYIIPEPVGSTHLGFDDDIVLYELCDEWPKVVRSPGWDHGHDEESRNVREVKIDILEGGIRISERFQVIRVFSGVPEGFRNYTTFQYIDLYLSDISRLLVMSVISSGTLKYLQSLIT